MEIIYHGHACLSILLNDGTKLLVDPYFTDNPLAKRQASEISADYILATHGHTDHIADLIPIAKKEKATVIAIAELATWVSQQKIKAHGMNIGGSFQFPFGEVKMVFAQHSSSFTKGEEIIYLGEAAGFILQADGKTLYLAGDTAYFSDMALLKNDFSIDVAFLPIGDNYTMGLTDATKCAEAIGAKQVIPIHYNTFPAIQQDPEAFVALLKEGQGKVLAVEESLFL